MDNAVLDFLFDGLEKWLELERELGVKSLEVDRALLKSVAEGAGESEGKSEDAGRKTLDRGGNLPSSTAYPAPSTTHQAPSTPPPAPSTAHQAPSTQHQAPSSLDFVFLHDRPLDAKGLAMMAKIIPAMGKTPDTAPVIIEPPLPKAKIYVVMGARALKLFFPGIKGEPGQWIRTPDAKTVLVTYSPAFLFRFGEVTPAVQKMKEDMWRSLKVVMQRVRQQ